MTINVNETIKQNREDPATKIGLKMFGEIDDETKRFILYSMAKSSIKRYSPSSQELAHLLRETTDSEIIGETIKLLLKE